MRFANRGCELAKRNKLHFHRFCGCLACGGRFNRGRFLALRQLVCARLPFWRSSLILSLSLISSLHWPSSNFRSTTGIEFRSAVRVALELAGAARKAPCTFLTRFSESTPLAARSEA